MVDVDGYDEHNDTGMVDGSWKYVSSDDGNFHTIITKEETIAWGWEYPTQMTIYADSDDRGRNIGTDLEWRPS